MKILECLQYLTANKRINTIFNLKVKMEKLALILFKLFAFFIFVYQMKNSISKYVEKPVAQLVSTVNFEQISEPLIYVCQKGQFNYTISKQHGYKDYSHLVLGTIDGFGNASWNGNHNDKSFQELQNLIFQRNYSKVDTHIYNHLTDAWEDLKNVNVYINPHGFCIKLDKINRDLIQIVTSKESTLFIVDPFHANTVTLLGRANSFLDIGHQENGLYESSYFDLEVNLYDSSIMNGHSCADYEILGTSYGECLKNNLKDFMLKSLGCLLPWFPDQHHPICKFVEKTEANDKAFTEIKKFLVGWKNTLHQCLPPCHRMSFRLKLVDEWVRENEARVEFDIPNNVTVLRDYYAYDEFSLIVDLGSALGLWMGLSALDIFQSWLYLLKFTKKFLNF